MKFSATAMILVCFGAVIVGDEKTPKTGLSKQPVKLAKSDPVADFLKKFGDGGVVNEKSVEKKEEAFRKEILNLLDSNRDGNVSRAELLRALRAYSADIVEPDPSSTDVVDVKAIDTHSFRVRVTRPPVSGEVKCWAKTYDSEAAIPSAAEEPLPNSTELTFDGMYMSGMVPASSYSEFYSSIPKIFLVIRQKTTDTDTSGQTQIVWSQRRIDIYAHKVVGGP